jgi:hypothetical protein
MILLKRGKKYRCTSAYLTDLEDARQCTVSSRAEVLLFLRAHPDRFFVLVGESNGLQEWEGNQDGERVYCGLVKWKSQEGVLHNKRFDFETLDSQVGSA